MTDKSLDQQFDELAWVVRHLLIWADGKNQGSKIDGGFLGILRQFRKLIKAKEQSEEYTERRLVINCDNPNKRLVINCETHKGPPTRDAK